MLGESSLDQIRFGLDGMHKLAERPGVKEKDLVDLAAEFNSIHKNFSALNEKFKARVKVVLLEDDRTIAEGHHHMAVLSTRVVSRLLTEKVKAFLGKHLQEFQETREEVILNFKARG